jgi:hypothetical protein
VLYSTCLILTSNYFEALNIIEENGMKFAKNYLFLGNLHKLMSIILYLESEREKSAIHFKLAKKFFERKNC